MYFVQTLSKILKKLDLFGADIPHIYKGSGEYTTVFGGCCTLAILITVISIFNGSIFQFIFLQFVQYSEYMQVDLESRVELSQKNFKFAVGITGFDLTNLSNPYLTIKGQYVIRYANGSRTRNPPVVFSPCNQTQWTSKGAVFKEIYTGNSMSNYLCSPDFNYSLVGQYGAKEFSYLKLSVTNCTGKNCGSSKQLSSIIKGLGGYLQFNLVFMGQSVDYRDTFNPLVDYPSKIYFRFTPYYQISSTDQFVKKRSIFTDISVLPFNNVINTTSFEISNQVSNDVPGSLLDSQFFRLFLRASPDVITIDRKVQSLDNFLSFIGGIFGVLKLVGAIFIGPLSQFLFSIQYFNQHYQREHKSFVDEEEAIKQYKNPPNPMQFSLYRFVLFKISDSFEFFYQIFQKCKSIRLSQYKLMNKLVEKDLDINQISLRLHALQKAFEIIFTNEELESLLFFNRRNCTREVISCFDRPISVQKAQRNLEVIKSSQASRCKSKLLKYSQQCLGCYQVITQIKNCSQVFDQFTR